MPKPYPIIYLPKASDQETLVRGLYRMGHRYRGADQDATEDQMWTSWIRIDPACMPYVILHTMGVVSAVDTRDAAPGHTLVNSIPHFLSYTRRLGALPQVVASPNLLPIRTGEEHEVLPFHALS